MKKYLATFAVVLVFVICFLLFGGYMLLDISKHPWLAIGIVSAIIAAVVYAFIKLDDKIENLQKRIKELEDRTH